MTESLFSLFCKHVDETIFPKENGGETVAFIIDQAFIDDFCKKHSTTEETLLRAVRSNLNNQSFFYGHLHIKGILAIQLYAATKREDSGGITEKNYRDRLSQVLNLDLQDLQSWMVKNQESYWERLYSWCDHNDMGIAKCSRKIGAGRYVQYPVQQAARVFTQKDLKAIAYHFVSNNLQPGEDISEIDFWRILSKRNLPKYVHTHHGRRLVEVDEYLPDAYRQVYNFYLRWDGSYLDNVTRNYASVTKERYFLFLSEDGHLDIRDDRMRIVSQVEWSNLSSSVINSYYSFKHSQYILFRKSKDYDCYWEETRFLEKYDNGGEHQYEAGMAVVFNRGYSVHYYYEDDNPFSHLTPMYCDGRVKIYRFNYSLTLSHLYTEKKFFGLEGGLKIGRMQYLLGGAPILTMEKNSKFWIDGENPKEKLLEGSLTLNFLKAGPHDIKVPGFKKIEFSIVEPDPYEPIWDDSYDKWTFSRKNARWLPEKADQGIVGLDFSLFSIIDKKIEDTSVLTRWARFHFIGSNTPDESNVALRILKQQ